VPDFQGGLIVKEYDSIRKLDGVTGQSYPTYIPNQASLVVANGVQYKRDLLGVHTDGTIFTVQTNWDQGNSKEYDSVVGLDPTTGAQKFSAPLESGDDIHGVYGLMIAGDGYAYVPYAYEENAGFAPLKGIYCCIVTHLMLLRVDSSGVYSKIPIKDYTTAGSWGLVEGLWVNLITNADQGAVLTWKADPDSHSNLQGAGSVGAGRTHGGSGGLPADGVMSSVDFGMAITTGTSVSLVNAPGLPGQADATIPVLQAQDGSFVGTAWAGEDWTPYMVAFDAAGNVRWTVTGDYQPKIATADGGVIAQAYNPDTGDYTGPAVTFDQNGIATGTITLYTQSWRGNMYQDGPVEQVVVPLIDLATTLWAMACGNPSGNCAAAPNWDFKLVWENNFSIYPDNPQYLPNLAVDATSQAAVIKRAALAAFKAAFNDYTVAVSEGRANTGTNRANVVNGYNFNQDGPSCGLSSSLGSHDSNIYYLPNMEQSQWALPIVLSAAQDVQSALGRIDLMKAIGAGIGNNAAHELGHQFFLLKSGMDDSSKNTYNGQGCNGDKAPWVYGKGPIKWEDITDRAWQKALGVGK
jgi:hypothetical protein